MRRRDARIIAAVVCAAVPLLLCVPGTSRAQDSTSTPGPIVPISVRSEPGPAFAIGCTEYVLKYGGGSGTQGTYGALDLSGSPGTVCDGGAQGYLCGWAQGCACGIDSGTCLPSEAGNLTGPTAQAIQSRFSADTDQRQLICAAEYHGSGQRVIIAPVTAAQGAEGCAGFEVHRFARLFLTRIPGSGDRSFVYVNFLGYATGEFVGTRQATWGMIKQIYR